jgi:hypothetical protein
MCGHTVAGVSEPPVACACVHGLKPLSGAVTVIGMARGDQLIGVMLVDRFALPLLCDESGTTLATQRPGDWRQTPGATLPRVPSG